MTDHAKALEHYSAQGDHARDLAELKRLRAEVDRKDAINAELAAALRGLIRAGHGLTSSSIEWNAAHAVLAKVEK